MKKGVSILLIGLFLLLIFSFVKCKISVEADSQVIQVPEDFPTIRQAIDNASSGATILVASGIYREYLNITNSLSIVGESRASTIIEGEGAEYVVSITADDVTIQSLTVTKSISGPNDGGIHVSGSRGTVINDVEITNTYTGLTLDFCTNDAFSDNILANNTYAVMLSSSSNNVFSDNTISHNSVGVIFYFFSNNNVFSGNTFSANPVDVIILQSNMNFFYRNNFFDTIQVLSQSTNVWSRDGEGNYWAHYNFTGRDSDNDGVGDEPFYIDENNEDDYPLMGAFSEYTVIYEQQKAQITIISNSTISNFKFEIGRETGYKIAGFSAAGEDGTFGFCRMSIPKSLMGYPLIVVDNEGEVTPSLLSTSNVMITYLYFTYPHGDQSITIVSSEALQIQSQLLDEYAKLQADFNSLNATYQALLTSYDSKLQAEIDNMNVTYQTLMNSFTLLLQNLSDLQNSYASLNSSLQKTLTDQSASIQNIQSLAYIFAATTGAFLTTTAYLATRVSTTRKWKNRAVEEEG